MCGKEFSRRDSLVTVSRHTPEESHIRVTVWQAFHLVTYERTHNGQKAHQCDLCHKAFSHAGDLVRQERTHAGEMPYQCDRAFSQTGNLVRYQRTHTGEKPYQCDRAFSQTLTGNLVRYQRTHTGEKPYQCGVCGKALAHFSCEKPFEKSITHTFHLEIAIHCTT